MNQSVPKPNFTLATEGERPPNWKIKGCWDAYLKIVEDMPVGQWGKFRLEDRRIAVRLRASVYYYGNGRCGREVNRDRVRCRITKDEDSEGCILWVRKEPIE